ncbi:hypothetical protein GCM10010329_05320 [Streptomyces spiroverticillatus]|uniref:Integral membrane protein n=1 Tax=Streptomyces finlayi TaxID=67296 RepID=A0A919C7E0_9ACTN|nr:DUF6350 family protein [Streptomyces finlayi]GGZ88154.1 hypothetical protein GCM10010329_05320 [Streptomyces spiroverticillatus]GHC79224.1 hypothetical protein GCM10010334_05300 [Streptomyces finlayi]
MNPNPVTEQPLPQALHEEQQEHPEHQEPHPGPGESGDRRAAWVACVVRGALAAGLGLGAFAVLAMVLWISSPYPDAGAGAALHVAAGLWLLAHGADLVRTDTLGGVAAPVGLTPLLCSVLPLWLAHRTARDACEEAEEDAAVQTPAASGWESFAGVTLGYLLVGTLAAVYAAGGPLPATAGSAALWLPLTVGAAAAAGVWTAFGRPHGPLPHWVPAGVRHGLARPRLAVAVRAAAAGTAVLVGGGALVVGISLGWHADLAQASFVGLAGEWSGRFGVLLLALALVPNAALWGASFGIGVGFEVGAGTTVGPLAAVGTGTVPPFPLLAALPAEGRGTAVNWASAGVPLAAAAVVAWMVVRVAAPAYAVREEAWGRRRTAGAVALAGVGCGALTAVLAAASGGPLGVERLAVFGPVGWAAGLGALGWVVLVGVPVALGVRAWRVRERKGWRRVPAPAGRGRAAPAEVPSVQATPVPEAPLPVPPPPPPLPPPAPPEQGSWHDSGAREVRWAALREGSGGLMAEVREEEGFPPSAGDGPSPPLP